MALDVAQVTLASRSTRLFGQLIDGAIGVAPIVAGAILSNFSDALAGITVMGGIAFSICIISLPTACTAARASRSGGSECRWCMPVPALPARLANRSFVTCCLLCLVPSTGSSSSASGISASATMRRIPSSLPISRR